MNDEIIYAEVKQSSIHNKGIFAIRDIPKGTRIMEYKGERISKDEASRRLDITAKKHDENPEEHAFTYIFELDDEWDLDGDVPNNDAKYINHSCDPNCDIEIKDRRIWIIALRDIKSGEELHYNYGFDIDEVDPYEFKNYPCYCGSEKCVGFMLDEDEWDRMKDLLEKERSGNTSETQNTSEKQ